MIMYANGTKGVSAALNSRNHGQLPTEHVDALGLVDEDIQET